MPKPKDLIIIGGGIAGVAASVYAKRSGLDFLTFEPQAIGGQLLFMQDIDNYVGVGLGTKGAEMAQTLAETLRKLEVKVVAERINKISRKEKVLTLITEDNAYQAKAVIVATGASFKKLGFKGEEQFSGRGVSYCAVCDGFFFKGKEVAVVGGGNTAAEEALYLSEIASKVMLIHRRGELRALDYLQKQLKKTKNIEIIYNSTVVEAKGKGLLEEIVLEDVLSKKKRKLALGGLFVAIGIKPATDIFKGLVTMDKEGFIITDEQMQSSLSSLWACGDCRLRPLKQLITAASEGAIAALGAYKYLRGHYISS